MTRRYVTTSLDAGQDTSQVLTIEQVKDMAKSKGFAPGSPDEKPLVEPADTKATPEVEPTVKAEVKTSEKDNEQSAVNADFAKQLSEMQEMIKSFATKNAELESALDAAKAESEDAKAKALEANNKAIYMSKRTELGDVLVGLKGKASKLRDDDRKLTPAGYSALFSELDLDELTAKSLEGSDGLAKASHVLEFISEYGISADGSQISTFSFENPLVSSEGSDDDGLTPQAKAFIAKMGVNK